MFTGLQGESERFGDTIPQLPPIYAGPGGKQESRYQLKTVTN